MWCSDSDVEEAILKENPYSYVPTGHTGLDRHIKGLIKGGLTFVKAPPNSGKTEIIRYLERAMLKHKGIKIALIHMEEMRATTWRSMATYELGVNVRTKEDAKVNDISEDQVIKAAKAAAKNDRTIVFEMRSGDNPIEIVEYCRLAAGVYGADYVFVDHVQRLAYLSGVDRATATLTELAANLAQLSKELNIGIILISHVNEDGATKYARSLEEEAIVTIKVERDQTNEDDVIRNTAQLIVTKNRPFASIGDAGKLSYDTETTILKEILFDA